MNQKHVTFPLSVNTHTFVINSTFNITTEKKKYQSTKQWDISFNTQQSKQTVVTLQYLWCKYRKQNFRLNAALQKLDNKFKGDVNKKTPYMNISVHAWVLHITWSSSVQYMSWDDVSCTLEHYVQIKEWTFYTQNNWDKHS